MTRSTLAAVTLALTDRRDTADIANLITDILQIQTISVTALTDNKSLHGTIKTSKPTLYRRLHIEVSAFQEICGRNEISIHWISKQLQLSDFLTKKGASIQSPMKVLQEGKTESVRHKYIYFLLIENNNNSDNNNRKSNFTFMS